jgi:chemotaxis protein methyltransferase CheR
MIQEFTNLIFEKYSDLIFKKTGINFCESKKIQLETKIRKAMSKSGYNSFEDYFFAISQKANVQILQQFINILTTNITEFFREREHFDFIANNISTILRNNPSIQKHKEIRIWCAASSTGQEPISIAITLKESLDLGIDMKILATDIDSNVLKFATTGIYTNIDCNGIPKEYLNKYFDYSGNEHYKVKNEILNLIRYRQFNLMDTFNFKKNFDIIFCRNVMIYFNRDTQELLVNKFYENLASGGYFFAGHTESLINKKHYFKSIAPSIYYKQAAIPEGRL